MGTTSNNTTLSTMVHDIGFNAPPVERYFVAFFTCLFGWPMTCLYILIIYVICRNESLRNNPFFILAINLGIADLIQMATILLHGVFVTANGNPWEFPMVLNEIHVDLQNISFFAQLLLMNVIAVNRYIATCWYHAYKRVFTKRLAHCICGFIWVFAFTMNICRYFANLKMLYVVYSWNYDDDVVITDDYSRYLKANDTVVMAGICCPFLIYFILIIHFRKIQKSLVNSLGNTDEAENRRRRSEKILMFQFSVITVVFTLYESSFQFVFLMFDVKVAFIVLNFLNILNCTINPIMYLSFGSELKKHINFTSKQSQTTTLQSTPAPNSRRKTIPCQNTAI